ncbi:MAG: hypothetical protein U0R44_05310 [Candidatus Micrarchaeia archaeon]
MPLNIIADFFNFINLPLFDSMSVMLVISFIVWEIPRSIKVIDEEYTHGLYPESGRVVDFVLFFIGLLSIAFYLLGDNSEAIVRFLHTPGITAIFLILLVTIPLIITMGYLKRFFGRMEAHKSITVFLTHAFLDLMHTLFHIALCFMFIPVAGLLILGPK